jgi:hypothetical protein
MSVEWGYRNPWGDVTPQPSELRARLWVEGSFPNARVLVRREVGPWQEVPAATPPDRSGRWIDGQLQPFGPRDLDGWQPMHGDVVAGD